MLAKNTDLNICIGRHGIFLFSVSVSRFFLNVYFNLKKFSTTNILWNSHKNFLINSVGRGHVLKVRTLIVQLFLESIQLPDSFWGRPVTVNQKGS